MTGPAVPALAPRGRRLLAFVTDLVVSIGIAQLMAGLVGLAIPLDQLSGAVVGILVGWVPGFAYLGFATPWFGNTLGKWLFGLRVVGVHGQRVSALRWAGRLCTLGLWPINGVMVLVRASRRHLGDHLGQTVVLWGEPGRGLVAALLGAVVAICVALSAGKLGLSLGIVNSEAWAAAKTQLLKEYPGAQLSWLPAGYRIVNDDAVFEAEVQGAQRRVALRRMGERWEALPSVAADEVSGSESFHFGE